MVRNYRRNCFIMYETLSNPISVFDQPLKPKLVQQSTPGTWQKNSIPFHLNQLSFCIKDFLQSDRFIFDYPKQP